MEAPLLQSPRLLHNVKLGAQVFSMIPIRYQSGIHWVSWERNDNGRFSNPYIFIYVWFLASHKFRRLSFTSYLVYSHFWFNFHKDPITFFWHLPMDDRCLRYIKKKSL